MSFTGYLRSLPFQAGGNCSINLGSPFIRVQHAHLPEKERQQGLSLLRRSRIADAVPQFPQDG